MDRYDELSEVEVDAGWASAGAEGEETDEFSLRGAFDHASQRRLGLRVPTNCWALLRGRSHSVYAVAVELSVTGAVLELVGTRGRLAFRSDQRFGLDLFVPGASAPVRLTVRPVRAIDERLEAFEFVESSAVDRLTLAEHLDRLLSERGEVQLPRRERPRAAAQPARPKTSWPRVLVPFAAPRAGVPTLSSHR